METLIPSLTIISMAVSGLICIAIPVALYIILRKKGANHLPFWIGCIIFVLFVYVFERGTYTLLSKTPFWLTVSNNFWLLGIFGGFMAGFFEETGRYIAMKTVLRKKRANDYNGLMYGAGHGGIEAVILLSVPMIINVIFSLQTNAGVISALGTLDNAQALANTPFWKMLVGAVERIAAVAIHVSLSVLVWFAAKDNKKFWLYPLAILLHLVVDAVAVILSRLGVNVWIIEGAVYAMAIALIFLAIAVWKKNHVAAVEAAPAEEAVVEAEAQA
ncbi:MAG: YhfC family glutamic-type intramembrane protease, partial [Eubacteriales bacterium]